MHPAPLPSPSLHLRRLIRLIPSGLLLLAVSLLPAATLAQTVDPPVERPAIDPIDVDEPPDPEDEQAERVIEDQITEEEMRRKWAEAHRRLLQRKYPQIDINENDVLIEVVPDPIEPFNRLVFEGTEEVLNWVVYPIGYGYRWIFPAPVRNSIHKFGYNLEFPVRLVNNLLQGEPAHAAHETGRFVVNSTVGLLGFFDPASRIGLHTFDEDFGQTFGMWGAGPGFYLFNPADGGGSSGRDTVGWVGDTALDAATYIPGLGILLGINDFTFQMDQLRHLTQSQSDPYILAREFSGITRLRDVIDYVPPPEAYEGQPMPTLGALYLEIQDPRFNRWKDERTVRIEATGEDMPYSLWIQDDRAPLVYLLPGIGGHRNSGMVRAIGERLYNAGFSVATISSPFNWEFMTTAATTPLPGYTPADAWDVGNAVEAVQRDLATNFDDRITTQSLMGLSLGGLHTLYLAGIEGDHADDLRIERYVAVNPPVRPIHPLDQLDEFFNVPLEWPEDERRDRIVETMLKALFLSQAAPTAGPRIPLNETESQFLIGVTFRYILRNTIYITQKQLDLRPRTEFGDPDADRRAYIVARDSWLSRENLYREISAYGFRDYMELFVLPYYWEYGIGALDRESLIEAASLTSLTYELMRKTNVHVFTTQNDFVIEEQDLEWIGETFGARATIYTDGGHLGQLPYPRVQNDLVQALQNPAKVGHDAPPGEPVIIPLAPLTQNGMDLGRPDTETLPRARF